MRYMAYNRKNKLLFIFIYQNRIFVDSSRKKNIKETDSLNLSKSNNVNRMDKFHMKYRVRKKVIAEYIHQT